MKTNKKGFTIVELVIVIAVIAILAAVLIPTFSKIINKAQKSSDTQLIRNLNGALAINCAEQGLDKCDTAYDAFAAVEEAGYNVSKIVSKSGYNIAYDTVNGYFVLLDEQENQVLYPISVTDSEVTKLTTAEQKVNYFVVRTNVTEATYTAPADYSLYCGEKFNATTVILNGVGFDAGETNGITTVTYQNDGSAKEVIIRTNGGTLNVGTSASVAKGQINHYGVLDKAIVYTETSCFHTSGAIGKMELKAGKAIAEDGGIVYLTEAKGSDVSVEENGGKFIIPSDVTTEQVLQSVVNDIGYTADTVSDSNYDNSKRTNSAYEIGTLAELETFRDLVNGGFTFAGCTVELTADIKLNDGWVPIGEGSRKVGKTNTLGSYATGKTSYFSGKFNGNGHTISNLNNSGYTPNGAYLDNKDNFVYGFFGILANGSVIENLTITNVKIDTLTKVTDSNGNQVQGDSVGALVGFADNNVTIKNVTVGTESDDSYIKGVDSIGGVIGRWYHSITNNDSMNQTIENCINYADITVTNETDQCKGSGIVGFISNNSTNWNIKNNLNYGSVSVTGYSSSSNYGACAAGIYVYQGATITEENNYNFGTITLKDTNADVNEKESDFGNIYANSSTPGNISTSATTTFVYKDVTYNLNVSGLDTKEYKITVTK